jgi:hypothetical protein
MTSYGPHLVFDAIASLVSKPEHDIVVFMPHVPRQTAYMVAKRLGLRLKRGHIIAEPREVRGLPPGKIHVIEIADHYAFGQLDKFTYSNQEMLDALAPYGDSLVWHDCDTVMGVE